MRIRNLSLTFRENFLKFKVFFGEYSYELVEQVPSYDLKVLLGENNVYFYA